MTRGNSARRVTKIEPHHYVGGSVERDRLVRFLVSLRKRHAENLGSLDEHMRAQAQMADGLLAGLISEAKAGSFTPLRRGSVWLDPTSGSTRERKSA